MRQGPRVRQRTDAGTPRTYKRPTDAAWAPQPAFASTLSQVPKATLASLRLRHNCQKRRNHFIRQSCGMHPLITTMTFCPPCAAKPQLIACLGPARRLDIKVTGTR